MFPYTKGICQNEVYQPLAAPLEPVQVVPGEDRLGGLTELDESSILSVRDHLKQWVFC